MLFRIRSGESAAATDLYQRYAKRIRAIAKKKISPGMEARVEADDIVQSVFRTFFRRVGDGQYKVPDGKELWGLFLVIALNKVRSVARYHGQGCRDVGRTRPLTDDLVDAGEDDLLLLQQVVDDVIRQLPTKHRTIVTLRIEGHTVPEIAVKSGLARRTVERVLQRFRERLTSALDEEGNDEPAI